MIVCPRCEGQRYDVGSCALCGNTGVLDEHGEKQTVLVAAEHLDRLGEAYRQGLTGRAARRWAMQKDTQAASQPPMSVSEGAPVAANGEET